MNKLPLFFLFAITFFSSCSGQDTTNKNELAISDFNWKLKIPEFLISENKDEWKKAQDRGKKGIEDTYNVELKNKVKTIFIFKSQDQSFFEATSENFNPEMASDYIATCKRMNDIFYNSITTQVPNAKVDTLQTVETIDNIQFQTLTSKMSFPNGSTKNAIMFRHLFKDTELTVSVMFSNEQTGRQIIEAFKKSSFHFEKE